MREDLIDVDRIARGGHRGRASELERFASDLERQRAWAVRGEPQHERAGRIARERLARVANAVRRVRDPGASGVEIEPARIVRHVVVRTVEPQFQRAGQADARVVRLSDARQVPLHEQGVVGNRHALRADDSEDACPEPSAPDRHRLALPSAVRVGRRAVVSETMRLHGERWRRRAERQRRSCRQHFCFHRLSCLHRLPAWTGHGRNSPGFTSAMRASLSRPVITTNYSKSWRSGKGQNQTRRTHAVNRRAYFAQRRTMASVQSAVSAARRRRMTCASPWKRRMLSPLRES